MSAIIQPISHSNTPEFLTIGHMTRDVHDDGSFSLGGTVTFAALTAFHLGLAAAMVTCVDAHLEVELPVRLPGIGLASGSSPAPTTFDKRYTDVFRIQNLCAWA